MKKIIFIGAILQLFILTTLSAQTNYTGRLVDADQNPLIGATISNQSTVIAVTNDNGEYNFDLDQAPRWFSIAYLGLETRTVTPERLNGTITLHENELELNQIIISANRQEQARVDVPAAVGVLTRKQIEQTKATQIDQLVNQMTGVYMSNLGNESHTMSIRSPLSYRALFLFSQDGVPVRPTGNFSHTALKELDNASFKRIEVVRGSNSSVYGSEAISGVINAITLDPSSQLSGRVSVQGNTIGFKRAELNISNSFGNTGVFLGGHYGQVRDGWRDHSDMDKIGTTFKITHKASNKLNFSLTGNYISLDSDRTGNLDSMNFYGKNLSSLHTFTNSKTNAFRANVQANYMWSDKNFTKAIIFHRSLENSGIPHFRIRNNRKDKTKARGEYREGELSSYGLILNHSLYLDKLASSIKIGGSIDITPESNKKKRLAIKRDDKGRYISYQDINKVFEDYQVDYLNTAAFAQFDFTPLSKLRVSTVLRYDYFKYKYESTEELTLLAGITNDKETFSNLTPKIGLTYDLGHNSGVYTNYSMGFVPPQIRDVYGADHINRAIKPQIFHNYEVGGWITLGDQDGLIDLSLYQLSGTNELVNVVLPDGSEENRNVGSTSHRGVEIGIKYKLTDGLYYRYNGSYALHKYDKYDTGKKDYSGKFMQRAPKWIWNTALDYSPAFLPNFRIGIEYQHLGEYYMSPDNNPTKVYGGFDLLHLRTSYTYKGIELWLNVLNLTDQLYAEISDVSSYSGKKRFRPGNPRNFNIGLQYNFGK